MDTYQTLSIMFLGGTFLIALLTNIVGIISGNKKCLPCQQTG